MMKIERELKDFYSRAGFGDSIGKRTLTVPVYTGCLLVPLPNIEMRHKYLKYHDLHHLITGFSVGRIGEGEVSAWELGTGSFFINPILGIMNFIALSTGLVLEPKRMWEAFKIGAKSKNLYKAKTRKAIDSGQYNSVNELRERFYTTRRLMLPVSLRAIEFFIYALISCMIHAAIAIPALFLRVFTDIWLKKNLIQAIKPYKRNDLY